MSGEGQAGVGENWVSGGGLAGVGEDWVGWIVWGA